VTTTATAAGHIVQSTVQVAAGSGQGGSAQAPAQSQPTPAQPATPAQPTTPAQPATPSQSTTPSQSATQGGSASASQPSPTHSAVAVAGGDSVKATRSVESSSGQALPGAGSLPEAG
jgi:hypothetical protein